MPKKSMKKVMLTQEQYDKLYNDGSVRDELLRYNNSYFNWRSEDIPLIELIKVRKDLTVSSLIESRLSGIIALKYSISSENKEELDFIDKLLKKIKVNKIIRGAFKAVLFGFAPATLSWETSGGFILPKQIFFRSPRGWRYGNIFADNNDDELYYGGIFSNEIKASDYPYQIIPIFRNRDDIFPLGEGILEKLFWHTQYKNAGLDFWTKFAEKFGSPYTIVSYGDTAQESLIQKLKDLAKQITGGGWGVIPESANIKTFEPVGKGQSSEIYRDLLTYCREDISQAILGHTGGAVSTAGKLGNESMALEVRSDISLSDAVVVEDFINSLIEMAVKINFAGENRCAFEFYKEKSNKELAERDKLLKDCGAIFTKKYFSKTYSIPEDLLGDELLSAKTASFAAGVKNTDENYDVFEELTNETEAILSTCQTYEEAQNKLVKRFADISVEPLKSMLETSLIYTKLKGMDE